MSDTAFRQLLDLARALRLAQKGNLALGIKPDPSDAKRLEAALDHFIAEYNVKEYPVSDSDGMVIR